MPKKGSFNSFPHIRNLEENLNRIIEDLEKGPMTYNRFILSPVEKFLLIMGVVLHDIGQLVDNKKKESDNIYISPPECILSTLKLKSVEEGFLDNFKTVYRSEITPCLTTSSSITPSLDTEKKLESLLLRCKHCLECNSDGLNQIEGGFCEKGIYQIVAYKDFIEKDTCDKLSHCPLLCYFCLAKRWNSHLVSISDDKSIKKDHSVYTWEMLRDPATYYALGIQSSEIANSLAYICLYHGPLDEIQDYYNSDSLNTIYLDPYGRIREMEIAVLLKLADTIDGSYRRALPEYIPRDGTLEVVGRFRKKVRGISVIPKDNMILTELGDWSLDSCQMDNFMQYAKDVLQLDENLEIPRKRLPILLLGRKEILMGLEEINSPKQPDWGFLCTPEWKKHNKEVGSSKLPTLLQKVLGDLHVRVDMSRNQGAFIQDADTLNEIYVPLEEAKSENKKHFIRTLASEVFLLQIILSDVKKNRKTLDEISSPLHGIGLKLYAWLIEYREHLFDIYGNETYEPIYNKEFLIQVVRSMWHLSATIFGQSHFTYENLAAALHEPDVEKVKSAVRRIKIVTQNMRLSYQEGNKNMSTDDFNDALWYGEQLWKWNTKEVSSENYSADLRPMAALFCKMVHIEDAIKNELKEITSGTITDEEKKKKIKKIELYGDALITFYYEIYKLFIDGKHIFELWEINHHKPEIDIDHHSLRDFIMNNSVTSLPPGEYLRILKTLAKDERQRIEAMRPVHILKEQYKNYLDLIMGSAGTIVDEVLQVVVNNKMGTETIVPDSITNKIDKRTSVIKKGIEGMDSNLRNAINKDVKEFMNQLQEPFVVYTKERLKRFVEVLYTYKEVIGEYSFKEIFIPRENSAKKRKEEKEINGTITTIIDGLFNSKSDFSFDIVDTLKSKEGFDIDGMKIQLKDQFNKVQAHINSLPRVFADVEIKYIDVVRAFSEKCVQEFTVIRDNFKISIKNNFASRSIALLRTVEMLHALMTQDRDLDKRIAFVLCDDVVKRICMLASPSNDN